MSFKIEKVLFPKSFTKTLFTKTGTIREKLQMRKTACASIVTVFAILILTIPLAQAYDNSTSGFSITPPSGWSTKENEQGVIVQFLGPADPDTGNVNINIDVKNTDLTLEGVVSKTKQEWSTTLAGYSLISEDTGNLSGHTGTELVVSFQYNGAVVYQDSILFVENGKVYQVSYVAGSTAYDTYLAAFTQSLSTFQIQSSSTGISFSFEITGIPFIILIISIVAIVVLAVILSRRKRKSKSMQSPPPP